MDQQEESHRSRRPRCLSVRRSETSLIKDEFDSLRERFDAEMRQMEADMARFRSQIEKSSGANSSRANQSETSSSDKLSRTTTTTSTTKSTRRTTTSTGQFVGSTQDDSHDWLNEFAQSPIVISSTGEGGNQERSLKLRFDVSAYKPEEIVVKTFEDRLQVQARHEQTTEHEAVSSEYQREFLLPEGVDHDQIKSTLSLEGILTVEVPLAGN